MTQRSAMRAAITLAALALTAVLTPGCGASPPSAALHSRLLAATDLPSSWSVVPAKPGSVHIDAPCLSGLPAKGWTYATANFVEGTAIPTMAEVLVSGPQVQRLWHGLDGALSRCRTATITIAGKTAAASIAPLMFPRVARSSSAYAWSFRFSGVPIGVDFVLFQVGRYAGYITYSDVGQPSTATVRAFADAAAAKAENGSTAPVPGTVSIASTPVQTAHTALGAVAYRAVGSGPPLVLITGYGGTMEEWDPRIVDALAQHYRVVIFDNAGVGPTQAMPAPLTIDAMANQTSALIAALGLNRPGILGWSMGSMIAQALAVLHPAQVSRLILCASYPGDATTVRPSQQAINALDNARQAMSVLFPAGRTAEQDAYLAAISSYPAVPAVPSATVTAQKDAVDAWWDGTDPAGQRGATITAPTLIAGGTADRLDPVANVHALARLIPGAKLTIYPGAGHAFLFQDEAAFISQTESFLR